MAAGLVCSCAACMGVVGKPGVVECAEWCVQVLLMCGDAQCMSGLLSADAG